MEDLISKFGLSIKGNNDKRIVTGITEREYNRIYNIISKDNEFNESDISNIDNTVYETDNYMVILQFNEEDKNPYVLIIEEK